MTLSEELKARGMSKTVLAKLMGVSRMTVQEKETDWEICQSVGLRVWEFNEMIAGWVKRNPY